MAKPVLELAAQELAEATAKPPFLYELGPEGARKVLDDLQAAPVAKLDVEEKWITVPAEVGDVRVRIVKPVGGQDMLSAVLCGHGGGWVLGNVGMAWFWDCYTTDPAQRAEITASPLRASLEELWGLPPALVIVDENDVLRDEGEAYARKLSQATTAAIGQAIHTLHTALHGN
ncbi:alpha/beta hydrolase [Streptomyces sp. NBC_01340]|uniref:alpha/beta hydrolase fold domain-containing protein n=1 Tax=unclassified Streptomyces TaxID=2593676 RepID=UPI00224F1790|nr:MULTISPECIES: alpha/beta hydrolase fold domain-containing protein [unclassified Streptomyces]MCX4461909.1 alpha/beta hydrolase [Streptomyces sp. NBC_01719]MCX4490817.1 alpha/beta hydrolase [Streptomyces sp. NBC_01728]WSI36159.1 alpha/beta hydrolase [Streptomyces sp. NBC_01340]